MKNDPKCMPASRMKTTHTVTEIHAVDTLLTLNWTIIDGKHNAVALSEWNNHRAGLHPRSLFSHHKLTASKISAWF